MIRRTTGIALAPGCPLLGLARAASSFAPTCMNKKSAFDEAKYQAEKGNKLEYDGVRSQYEVVRPDGTSYKQGVRATAIKAGGTYDTKDAVKSHMRDPMYLSEPYDSLVVHVFNKVDKSPVRREHIPPFEFKNPPKGAVRDGGVF